MLKITGSVEKAALAKSEFLLSEYRAKQGLTDDST